MRLTTMKLHTINLPHDESTADFSRGIFAAGVLDDFKIKNYTKNVLEIENFSIFFYVGFEDEPNSILTLRGGTRFGSRLMQKKSPISN